MLFAKKLSISETKRVLACTEGEAFANLEKVAIELLKHARWHPYHTKIRELQKPLVQLKLARKKYEHQRNSF